MKLYLWANGDITGSNGKGKPPEKCLEMATKQKKYTITNTDYRYIVSAAANLQKVKKFKLIFLTFTFPFEPSEKIANKILTHFLNKLKRDYGQLEYIWTKERQQTGRLHFHAIIDIPFIPIKDLQGFWNNSINTFDSSVNCSNNSLRLPPKDHNIDRMEGLETVKYMAKYVTKERKNAYEQPCFAVSRGLRDVKQEIDTLEVMRLIKERGIYKSFGNDNYGVTMLKNQENFDKKRPFTRKTRN